MWLMTVSVMKSCMASHSARRPALAESKLVLRTGGRETRQRGVQEESVEHWLLLLRMSAQGIACLLKMNLPLAQ
jgi:hypothetical protein